MGKKIASTAPYFDQHYLFGAGWALYNSCKANMHPVRRSLGCCALSDACHQTLIVGARILPDIRAGC